MTELIEFLKAQLTEDERKANAELAFARHEIVIASRDRRRTPGKVPCAIQEMDDRATRMLREVEAKRAILDGYEAALAHPNRLNDAAAHLTMTLLGRVVCQLASVYRDHEAWREEWAA